MRLEPGVETGIVKRFDGRDNRRFGFIRLKSGEEIFFHYNDGRIAESGFTSGLCWDMPNRDSRTALDFPRVGDRLFFMREEKRKGPIASPWTSEKHYLKAVEGLWCPCSHHVSDHDYGHSCMKCDCPDFGTPTEAWETFTEVSFTEGPGGHKGYE